jgi:hypothetical protein
VTNCDSGCAGHDVVFNPGDGNEFLLALGLGAGIVRASRLSDRPVTAFVPSTESIVLGRDMHHDMPDNDDDIAVGALLKDLYKAGAQDTALCLDVRPPSFQTEQDRT